MFKTIKYSAFQKYSSTIPTRYVIATIFYKFWST